MGVRAVANDSTSSKRPTRDPRSREERSRLAHRLVAMLGDARGPNLGAFGAKTRARHAAIRESADDLLALVLRLRDDEPITERGAALIEALAASQTYPATITAARSKAAA